VNISDSHRHVVANGMSTAGVFSQYLGNITIREDQYFSKVLLSTCILRARALDRGIQEVHCTQDRDVDGTHTEIFFNQAIIYLYMAVASITIDLFQNLAVETVFSIFWLLYKQAVKVSTRP